MQRTVQGQGDGLKTQVTESDIQTGGNAARYALLAAKRNVSPYLFNDGEVEKLTDILSE